MIKTLTLLAANIPAAIVGGTVFILALIPLELGIGLSCMIGFCGYVIAGTWIFPSSQTFTPLLKEKRVERGYAPAEASQPESFTDKFKESEYQLSQMRALISQVRKRSIREKTGHIGDVAEQILDAIKNNPGDARTSQQFASYYLEPTNSILTKYLDIRYHNAVSDESHGLAERIELILGSVQLAFEKQHSNVLKDGMLYLDLEIAALEETIGSAHRSAN